MSVGASRRRWGGICELLDMLEAMPGGHGIRGARLRPRNTRRRTVGDVSRAAGLHGRFRAASRARPPALQQGRRRHPPRTAVPQARGRRRGRDDPGCEHPERRAVRARRAGHRLGPQPRGSRPSPTSTERPPTSSGRESRHSCRSERGRTTSSFIVDRLRTAESERPRLQQWSSSTRAAVLSHQRHHRLDRHPTHRSPLRPSAAVDSGHVTAGVHHFS